MDVPKNVDCKNILLNSFDYFALSATCFIWPLAWLTLLL